MRPHLLLEFFSNASAISSLGSQVYARFFVRLAAVLGERHVTFLAMKDANDGDDDVRVGSQDMILMYNRESDDATLPTMRPAGVAVAADPWRCVEFHIDQSAGTIDTWFNGTARSPDGSRTARVSQTSAPSGCRAPGDRCSSTSRSAGRATRASP